MKKIYKNLKDWSNANLGLLTLFAIVITLIGLIPFNKIDFGFTNTLMDNIIAVINYKIKIPFYLFLIIVIIGLIYFIKIRRKYIQQKITIDFLNGNWRNEWTVNGEVGSEMFQIKEGGKYFVNGEHWFTLEDFNYDYKTNKITFIKAAIRPGDNRRLVNILTLDNNDLISGKENNYDIKYSRL